MLGDWLAAKRFLESICGEARVGWLQTVKAERHRQAGG